MTTLCSTPESLPSPRGDSGKEPPPTPPTGFGRSFSSSRPNQQKDYDVPFFTVAHYKSPTHPTTYEYAKGTLPKHTCPVLAELAEPPEEGAGEALYNGSMVSTSLSPIEIAFGKATEVEKSSSLWLKSDSNAPPAKPPSELENIFSSQF